MGQARKGRPPGKVGLGRRDAASGVGRHPPPPPPPLKTAATTTMRRNFLARLRACSGAAVAIAVVATLSARALRSAHPDCPRRLRARTRRGIFRLFTLLPLEAVAAPLRAATHVWPLPPPPPPPLPPFASKVCYVGANFRKHCLSLLSLTAAQCSLTDCFPFKRTGDIPIVQKRIPPMNLQKGSQERI